MKAINLFCVFAILLAMTLYLGFACDDDDDDVEVDDDDFEFNDDDDSDDDENCINCSDTGQCLEAFGQGWACVDYCCEFLGTSDDDDDIYNDDDDIFDDDDTWDCNYVPEFTWLYEDCDVVFIDNDGNEMSLNEAIADCNSCVGDCAFAYIDEDDCDAAIACILDLCF